MAANRTADRQPRPRDHRRLRCGPGSRYWSVLHCYRVGITISERPDSREVQPST